MNGETRPVVHFTPPQGWLNDPNGLVSVGGRHHLYYQHNPTRPVPASMHWGHATSTDFVEWHHLPVALAPDEHGTIFSGSAVIDDAGSAGFGAGALVAVFTYHHDSATDLQSQALAWSTDGGTTFTKYAGNPVIPPEPGARDPKVFPYADGWVMVLAADGEVRIHVSDDLRTWSRTDVVPGFDIAGGRPETPDLFPLIADDGTSHWVLTVGQSPGAPAGGSGTAALIGDFDGTHFVARDELRWVDHGPHCYAAQSWNGVADGRRVWIAWMGNWTDGRDDGAAWRGQMTVARELGLQAFDGGYRLTQVPVRELADHRTPGDHGPALDVDIDGTTGVRVVCSRGDADVVVELDDGTLTAAGHRAEVGDGPVDLRVILDVASIEVFCGTAAITAVLDARDDPWTVHLDGGAYAGGFAVHRLTAHH